MYRLHGQDANWLYKETLTSPMHTLKIFTVSLAPGQRLDFEIVRKSTARLLHEVPMLRQRPVFVPFGLHHPVMIEDPEFDLDYHLNRAAIPSPGGQHELEEVLAHIHSHPLDRTRPLWQFWILEGLANGQVVLVHKIHHTLADGMASVNSLMRVWQSGYLDPHAVPPPWQPEPVPGKGRLLWDAIKDHVKYDIGNLPSFFKAIYRGAVAIRKQEDPQDSPTLRGLDGDIPKLPWNRALSARRSFAMAQLPLSELKALKDQLGGTLNDAVLGLVAGSLRNYLIEKNELPDKALLVTIPVAKDPGGAHRESGNATAVTVTLLHVNIADPLARYEAIRESTQRGKQDLEIVGRETFGLMNHYIPPVFQQLIAQRIYNKQLADKENFKLPANLSVSNVPGPREEFSTQGDVVADLYSAGPLVEGMGMNITVWSYAGNMNFTLVGCMNTLPDIDQIAQGLKPALQELSGSQPPAQSAANA